MHKLLPHKLFYNMSKPLNNCFHYIISIPYYSKRMLHRYYLNLDKVFPSSKLILKIKSLNQKY